MSRHGGDRERTLKIPPSSLPLLPAAGQTLQQGGRAAAPRCAKQPKPPMTMNKKPLPLQIHKTSSNSESSQPASPLDLLAAASLPFDSHGPSLDMNVKRYAKGNLAHSSRQRVEETTSFNSTSSNQSRHVVNGHASAPTAAPTAVHNAVLTSTRMQQSPILPLSPSSYTIPALPLRSHPYQDENGHVYPAQDGIPGKREFLSAFSSAFDAFWAPMEQARSQVDATITRADALLGTLGAAGDMVQNLVKAHYQVLMREWSGEVGRALTDLDTRLQALEKSQEKPATTQTSEDLLRQIDVLTQRIAHLEARSKPI